GLRGETLTLEALLAHDKPLLLIFSNPGCGPCQSLLPDIGRLQRERAVSVTVAVISEGTVEANRNKSAEHGLVQVLLQKQREGAEGRAGGGGRAPGGSAGRPGGRGGGGVAGADGPGPGRAGPGADPKGEREGERPAGPGLGAAGPTLPGGSAGSGAEASRSRRQ